MRIVFFTDYYYPDLSGLTIMVDKFKKELEKRGNKVLLVAPAYTNYKENDDSILRYFFIINSIFEIKLPRTFCLPLKLEKELRDFKPEIIHVHTHQDASKLALFYSKKLNIPIIYTYHGKKFVIRKKSISLIEEKFVKNFYNKFDSLTSPTSILKEYLESIGVKKKIFIVPNGIKFNKINFKRRTSLRKKNNIKENEKTILYLGRLVKEKNIDFLLDVFKEITKVRDDLKFFVIGDGSYKYQLERKTKKYGLEDKIIFTGEVSHEKVYDYYTMSDVFLFSSLFESVDAMPLVLLESMFSGLPIVAIKAPGAQDVIKNEYNGFLANDINDFSEKLLKLMDDKKLRIKMSQNAKKESKKYSIEKSTDKLIKVYKEVIKDYHSKNIST